MLPGVGFAEGRKCCNRAYPGGEYRASGGRKQRSFKREISAGAQGAGEAVQLCIIPASNAFGLPHPDREQQPTGIYQGIPLKPLAGIAGIRQKVKSAKSM